MNRVFIHFIASIVLTGCVWNIDKPPPPWWTYFSGNGASELEIRIALLECGASIPGDPMEYQAVRYGGVNEILLVEKCMEVSGFPIKDRLNTCAGRKDTVTGRHIPADYPACKPGAVIPVRSVENRLKSPYCKAYPKAMLCRRPDDPVIIQIDSLPPGGSMRPISIPSYPASDPIIPKVQSDSNKQMNQLLKQR